METGLDTDLSDVRVHTGEEAGDLNRELGAQAFTTGKDIFLGQNTSPNDRRVLAHEVTHVVQQRSSGQGGPLTVGPADDAYEREADAVAAEIESQARPSAALVSSAGLVGLHRTVGNQAVSRMLSPGIQRDSDDGGQIAYQTGYQDGKASSPPNPMKGFPNLQNYLRGYMAGQAEAPKPTPAPASKPAGPVTGPTLEEQGYLPFPSYDQPQPYQGPTIGLPPEQSELDIEYGKEQEEKQKQIDEFFHKDDPHTHDEYEPGEPPEQGIKYIPGPPEPELEFD
jgi:hypothetical protein